MHFFISWWVGEEVAQEDIATHKVCAAKKSKTAKTKCVLFQKRIVCFKRKIWKPDVLFGIFQFALPQIFPKKISLNMNGNICVRLHLKE